MNKKRFALLKQEVNDYAEFLSLWDKYQDFINGLDGKCEVIPSDEKDSDKAKLLGLLIDQFMYEKVKKENDI